MQSWGSGDWMCGACQHLNFKKRDQCQRCQYPKYGGPDPSTYAYNRTEVLAGDWYCNAMNCGAHNYASRSQCYICGALKNMIGSDGCSVPGWKTGDWFCTRVGCGEHNYANRTVCYKCKTARDYGGSE
ncbi:zinc finger Ran-binding domain-containing protein 2 [Morus notabilis]|uniref:zinc finger Ran-binding domain-containing protein 2 n=1 Tax=Morus notabilis TaxID=981085 RepID=UPI000CED7777|nr:zinc finger Ran-binding domain-containing protein 2 [Morus notabilis]